MKKLDIALLVLAFAGAVFGMSTVASAGGADGCQTYFSPNGGPGAWVCVSNQCVFPGGSCTTEPGPFGTQCGCGAGATEVADCVLTATWNGNNWSINCQDFSCAPGTCPAPMLVNVPGWGAAWACPNCQ